MVEYTSLEMRIDSRRLSSLPVLAVALFSACALALLFASSAFAAAAQAHQAAARHLVIYSIDVEGRPGYFARRPFRRVSSC